MNETTSKKIVLTTINADGLTWRFFGNMQCPMDVEGQKRAGLIATVSRSITDRTVAAQAGGKS